MNLAQSFGYGTPQEFMQAVEVLQPEIHDHETRQARTVDLLNQVSVAGRFEGLFHRQDGTMMEANINVWAMYDGEGNPSYLEGTVEDVTERNQMERKLREMEELHESIIDLTSNL